MKTKIVILACFLIFSLACLETTITPITDPTPAGDGISAPSAVPAASLSENPAGAVFEVPESWRENYKTRDELQTRQEAGRRKGCLIGVCR